MTSLFCCVFPVAKLLGRLSCFWSSDRQHRLDTAFRVRLNGAADYAIRASRSRRPNLTRVGVKL